MADLFGRYDSPHGASATQRSAWSRLVAAVNPNRPEPSIVVTEAAHTGPSFRMRIAGLWRRRTGQVTRMRSRASLLVAERHGGPPSDALHAVSADGRISIATLGGGRDFAETAVRAVAGAGAAADPRALVACLARLDPDRVRRTVYAVYDRDAEVLTCLRGPDAPALFFFENDGAVWFGTRLPALRRLPLFPTGVDYGAVAFFLAFGFPPLDKPLFRGLARLRAGHALRITVDGWNELPCFPPDEPALADPEQDPEDRFRSVVADAIGAVAGRRVAILCAADDPRGPWLAQAARSAGAGEVLLPPWAPGFISFSDAAEILRRVVASEGDVFASPSLVAMAARARALASDERGLPDVCLVPDGSTTLFGGALRHRRFAANAVHAANARPLSGRGLDARPILLRDLYFDEIALFDDAARLAIAGPLIAQWSVFAMADELGTNLEAATAGTAADLAGACDRALFAPGGIVPLAQAVGAEVGSRLLAPFASDAVRARVEALTAEGRAQLASAFVKWPQDELAVTFDCGGLFDLEEERVREMLTGSTASGRELFGRVAVNDLLERHFDRSVPSGPRIWALCCLEIWFREFVDYRR